MRYVIVETLLMDHMRKPGNARHGHYKTLLETEVQCIAAAMHLKPLYVHGLSTPTIDGRFLISGEDCPSQTVKIPSKFARKKMRAYFVTVNKSEKCKIWVAPGSQIYVFCSDVVRAKLCKDVRAKEVKW